MSTQLFIACLITLVGVNSIPVPDNELDIVQVPLTNGKELDVLTLGDSQTLSERNKRTIGLLRELFPDITKQIDDQANKIISQVIRVLGPTVLRSAIQGNGGGAGGSSSAREDFDADFEDDDDDDNKNDNSSNSNSSDSSTRIQIELPTFSPDSSENETDSDVTTRSSTRKDDAETNAETKK